jgi:hypothetical protein
MINLNKLELTKITGGTCTQGKWFIPPSGGFFSVPGSGSLTMAYLTHSSGTVNVFCDGVPYSDWPMKKAGDMSRCEARQYMRLQSDSDGQGIYCINT